MVNPASALLFLAALLIAAAAAALALAPCGALPGEACGTDTQCECMHGEAQ